MHPFLRAQFPVPGGHMHLCTLHTIISVTNPMSDMASQVASSNVFFYITLYLYNTVLFAGNIITTATTTTNTNTTTTYALGRNFTAFL